MIANLLGLDVAKDDFCHALQFKKKDYAVKSLKRDSKLAFF